MRFELTPCLFTKEVAYRWRPKHYDSISETKTLTSDFCHGFYMTSVMCRWRDSNSHAKGQRVLRPLCLPFHHIGIFVWVGGSYPSAPVTAFAALPRETTSSRYFRPYPCIAAQATHISEL